MGQWEAYKALQDLGKQSTTSEIIEQMKKNDPGMALVNVRDYVSESLSKLTYKKILKRVKFGVYEIAAPYPERNVVQIKNGRTVRVKT